MTERRYDTRTREEILAADHFAPYRDLPGAAGIGLRELRTLDAFFRWSEATRVIVPTTEIFLSFCADDSSPRKLEDLRTAFDRLFPEETPVRQTIRDAIRAKRPRSRACDRRSRDVLLAEPHLAPFRSLPRIGEVDLEDLRVLERFLAFAAVRSIKVPAVADYLAFVSDVKSSRRLRSLQTALTILLPGNPGVEIVLAEAIALKSPARPSLAGKKPRPPAEHRVHPDSLPRAWRDTLHAMRDGLETNGRPAPALSRIKNMEDVLREYAQAQVDADQAIEISLDGLRRLEANRAARAAAIESPSYEQQHNRPATRHTIVMRLRQFAEHLGCDPLMIAAMRAHENVLRKECDAVVPLKFGRFDRLPKLAEIWALARGLLEQARKTENRTTRRRLLNEAGVVALWTLIALRLEDGRLRWGHNIYHDGASYRLDVVTNKQDEPLRGRLHVELEPFLDALILSGVAPAHLGEMRERAMRAELPVFRTTKDRLLARTYPTKVWEAHFGTGAHIARTKVHTELGRLGPEGLAAALAICAQRDPRTARHYEADRARNERRDRGQAMLDALLEEVAD